jgi:hypothetical protein
MWHTVADARKLKVFKQWFNEKVIAYEIEFSLTLAIFCSRYIIASFTKI